MAIQSPSSLHSNEVAYSFAGRGARALAAPSQILLVGPRPSGIGDRALRRRILGARSGEIVCEILAIAIGSEIEHGVASEEMASERMGGFALIGRRVMGLNAEKSSADSGST